MRRFAPPIALLMLSLASGACGGGGGSNCNSGLGTLPPDVEMISYDDGASNGSVRGKHFAVTDPYGHQFDLDTQPMWEAMRFQIDRPATIYGFSVTWTNLTNATGDGAEAGLYPDFGYNGFDFWRQDPIWTGSRCMGDVSHSGPDGVDYVLDQPVHVDQPGLVYVAHDAPDPTDATFAFDTDYVEPNGACGLFADCRAGIDLDQADTNFFYNGISFPFPYDYLVRLYVKYDAPPLDDADLLFHPIPNVTIGQRVAFGDYDSDGWDDIATWSTDGTGPVLYRNQGDGTFLVTTSSAGLTAMAIGGAGSGMPSWGDYDNDGCLDLFYATEYQSQPNRLLHNECNGTFTDVTATAAVGGYQTANTCGGNQFYPQSEAGSWVDIDGDGWLDLYVANYNCSVNPNALTDYVDNVYRNNHDGTFADWTGTHGFLSQQFAGRGADPIDVDFDGDVDIAVNDYVLERNLFYKNGSGGNVTEVAAQNGTQGTPHQSGTFTYYGHTIGMAWGDIDGDGDWDLVAANLAHPRFYSISDKTEVLINDGTGNFTDVSGDWSFPASATGLRYQETHTMPTLADFDQDGTLDLVLSSRYNGRPTDFYWGRGDGRFDLDVFHPGITTQDGWGMAVADVDHDGDPDLATETSLFRNDLQPAKVGAGPRRTKGHWLQVRAVGNGTTVNRAAIGATVKVLAGGRTYLRHVEGGTGQGCQDSLYLMFGLGDATAIDSISVSFPGGGTVSYPGPFATDQRLWLYDDGSVRPGWSNPG